MYISRNGVLFTIYFFCALYQLVKNFDKHMDKDYKIVPMLSISRFVDLPVVTLCFSEYLDYTKLEKQFPEIAIEIGDLNRLKLKSVRRSLYNRINLKQMLSVSISLEDFLKSCSIYDIYMTKQDCDHLSPVIEWISYEDKCFQFFAFRGQLKKKFTYDRDLLVNQEWLTFNIEKENIFCRDIGILVSAPNELLQPYSYNNGYIQIPTTFLDTLYIIIERFKIIRLPYPYDNGCRNYTGQHSSQMHCIYHCYAEMFRSLGKYPDQLLQRHPEEFYGVNLDKENRTGCIEKCKQKDCVIDKFELRISYQKLAINETKLKLVFKSSFSEDKALFFEPTNRNKSILSIISHIIAPFAYFLGISLFTIHLYLLNFTIYLIAIYNEIKKWFLNHQVSL